MSEELLQLLFLAFIFIALPALEGVLRGRKKRRGPMGRGPVEEAEVDREPAREREAPWDSAEESPLSAGERERAETPRSSEGLLPADLWEELAALARGERRPDRVPPVADDAPDRAAGTGPTEPERPEPRDVPLTTAGAEDYRAPSSQPATQRSRAPRPPPQKPAARRSWRDVEPHETRLPTRGPAVRQPPPAGGLASRRGGLVGQGAFPEPAWSPIETGAIGTTAEHGDQGAPADVLGTLQRMTKDDLKRAVIFREVLGPPISARPGPLAEWSAP